MNHTAETFDPAELLERLVETALYNEQALRITADTWKETIARLDGDVSQKVAKAVTAQIKIETTQLIQTVGQQLAAQMITDLKTATTEANNAADAYKKLTAEATSSIARVFRVAIVCSLIISTFVSGIFALLLRL